MNTGQQKTNGSDRRGSTIRRWLVSSAPVLAAAVGCAPAVHDHVVTTRPAVATDVDPQRADPAFWYAQYPAIAVKTASLDALWGGAETVSERYLFAIERRDRRAGVMTTVPNVSPQWFEPWRQELQTLDDVSQSSLATVRRSIRWTFERDGNGYRAYGKVLIEREVLTEERISGLLGRGYFQRRPTEKVYGTRETDRNVLLPDSYWYPIGRDFALERKLADALLARVNAVASG